MGAGGGEPEELISRAEFGRRCNPPISQPAVTKAIGEGRLVTVNNLLRASDVAEFDANRRRAAEGDDDSLSRQLMVARIAHEQAKGKREQLEADALAGELLYREDVEEMQAAMVMAARAKMLALPTRLAATLGPQYGIPELEIQTAAKALIEEALSELSGYDPEQYRQIARKRGRKVASTGAAKTTGDKARSKTSGGRKRKKHPGDVGATAGTDGLPVGGAVSVSVPGVKRRAGKVAQ